MAIRDAIPLHPSTLDRARATLFKERYAPYWMVGPTILTVFIITVGPMLWSLYLSFHRWNPGAINPDPVFNGIDNYVWLLTNPRFLDSVINLGYYAVVGVLLQVTLGTALALALYNYVDNRKIRVGLLTLFMIPFMYAPIVSGYIWKLLFLPGGSVINGILALVGISAIPWLETRWLGITAIMLADTWQWVGLPLIIVYGGRAGMSESMYEAARVDNASRFFILRHITLPHLKNLIVIAAILRFMGAYKIFAKLFVMTKGGPGTATELPTYFAYLVGFRQFNIGRAAAFTWFLGLGSVAIMYLFWRYLGNVEGV